MPPGAGAKIQSFDWPSMDANVSFWPRPGDALPLCTQAGKSSDSLLPRPGFWGAPTSEGAPAAVR
jgi:hypothetical protein